MREEGVDPEGKYSCATTNPHLVGENLAGGPGETKGRHGRDAGRGCEEGSLRPFTVLTSSPFFGSPGPSTPSTSPLSVRYDRRQELANSPWCKNLTLGCPAKVEGLIQSGAQLTPLFLGLLLPTPAKLN